jgi:3-oxoacyl-[acyl-carrier-protein] synthase-1
MAAAGAHEAIHTLLMMREGFIAATANLENIAPECAGVNHVQSAVWKPFRTAMSWNMGLGGANSCLVFRTV